MKIYISSCNLFKSGEKNGRKWNLYRIVDPKGITYSTFEAKYVGMVGQEIEVEVQERVVEKNGKTYKNLTIIEPKRGDGDNSFILAELKAIRLKLENLPALITEMVVKELAEIEPDVPDGGPDETDVAKEDVPPELPF